MLVLILGLLLFLGVHSFTMFRGMRGRVINRFGAGYYKFSYSAKSILGLGLIIWGFHLYRLHDWQQLWLPPAWLRNFTFIFMWAAFIALAASYPAPGKIRGWLRHPTLNAVKFWATAHLLTNGDLGGIILFASFLFWASAVRISLKKRADQGAPRQPHFTKADAIVLLAGTAAYGAMIFLHPYLIGVPV